MLLPIRDQGQGRRRRSYSHGSVYSGPRTARSSRFSLLSAITAQSSGSNGSNSTVTQESYNKSTRRRKSSRRKRETSKTRPPHMERVEESPPEDQPEEADSKEEDVFTYLVEEPSTVGDDTAVEHSKMPDPVDDEHEPEPDPVPYPEDGDRGTYFSSGSFHSDSGISMDEGSFTVGKAYMQPLLPQTMGNEKASPRRRDLGRYPEVPKPHHMPIEAQQQQPMHDLPTGIPEDHMTRPTEAVTPPSVFTDSDPLFPLSTDHLASELAAHDSPPLFKAFRKSNYRILLQLQDEITELQEELAELDVYDGSRRLGKGATTSESLRRLSFHWGQCDFDLYKAKAEILGRLQIRMDQYYKTLALSQKVHRLQMPQIGRSEGVLRFRQSLEHHFGLCSPTASHPEDGAQQHFAFLDDEEDLVTFNHNRASPADHNAPLISLLTLVPLLLPLLLFKVISGVLNRFLIVGFTLTICLISLQWESVRALLGTIESAQRNEQIGLVTCACIATLVGLLF